MWFQSTQSPQPELREIDTVLTYKANSLLVMGCKRCGKTEYVTRYVRAHKAQKVFLFDAEQQEFSRRLKVPCATNEIELGVLLERERIICYDPDEEFGSDRLAGLDWFLTYVWSACRFINGIKLVGVDELQFYISTQSMPQSLEDILSRGGRYLIDTVLIGQQANMLHNTVRNSVTEIIAFRTIDDTAGKYFKSQGFDPNVVKNLKDCHFLAKNARDGSIAELELKF